MGSTRPGALAGVPAPLRNRYFTPSGAGFEVAKSLRSRMIFGEHDLSARVPFPRIDLILCRNVLIYFTPPLQRIALETFAYSLRTGRTAGPRAVGDRGGVAGLV